MTNLVQIAEELEYVPKEQLIEMSQSPDSRYPQYLVLSEIQRRTQMEKMYNAQSISMNQPQTTVAEEVVTDFAQPQGLAGMNANGSGQAPMPASPMQMAAIGGRTGFQNMGTTSALALAGIPNRDRQQLLASLGIDPRGKTEEEIQRELAFMQTQAPEVGGRRLPDAPLVDTAINRQVDLEEVRSPPVSTEEDSSMYDSIMGGLAGAGKFVGVLDEKGKIDPLGAGLAALSIHPGFRAARWLGQGAMKFAPKIAKGLGGWAAKPFSKVKKTVTTKGGKKYDVDSPQGQAYLKRKAGKDAAKEGRTGEKRIFDLGKTSKNVGTAAAATAVVREVSQWAENNPDQPVAQGLADKNKGDLKDNIENKLTNLEGQQGGKGLGSYLNKFMNQADGLDIAALGGIIMGSRNMSEFGQRITKFAETAQDRRAGAKTEARLEALSTLQGDYYQAQIDQMEPEQLQSAMTSIAKMYKIAVDASDPDLANEYITMFNAYNKKLAELKGIAYTTPEERQQQDDKEAEPFMSVQG
tara:strand:- start:266 stop:1834 length:1569 start_codon:yes stop_codon:yes gene_type:complete